MSTHDERVHPGDVVEPMVQEAVTVLEGALWDRDLYEVGTELLAVVRWAPDPTGESSVGYRYGAAPGDPDPSRAELRRLILRFLDVGTRRFRGLPDPGDREGEAQTAMHPVVEGVGRDLVTKLQDGGLYGVGSELIVMAAAPASAPVLTYRWGARKDDPQLDRAQTRERACRFLGVEIGKISRWPGTAQFRVPGWG